MSVDKYSRDLALAYEGPVQHATGAGNLAMDANDLVVMANPPASGVMTITLPSVFAARGRTYSIISVTNATGTISVVGKGDELVAYTSGSLTAANDYVLLYSDGVRWYELAELTT